MIDFFSEMGFINWIWVYAAIHIGMMGVWLAAAEWLSGRADRWPDHPDPGDVPMWAPLYFISLSILLFIYTNRAQWFSEDTSQLFMEVVIAILLVIGSYWLFSELLNRYGLPSPSEQARTWIADVRAWLFD